MPQLRQLHSSGVVTVPSMEGGENLCELKAKSGLSYPEARRQVNATIVTPTPGKSYAQAAEVQTASKARGLIRSLVFLH